MAKLDVRNFSNIFDKGITDYAKFNWLSDGLPDGEYNGITKVTITSVSGFSNNRATTRTINRIPATTVTNPWEFGISNWPIVSANSSYVGLNYPNICADTSSTYNVFYVQIPGLTSVAEYNAYLAKHPIVLCYYDKNVWNGAMITASMVGGTASYLITNIGGGLGEVRDVKGDLKYITKVYSENWTTVYNSKETVPSIFRVNSTQYTDNIYVDDGNFNPPSDAANRTNFINKYFSEPRAIVYKK